MKTKVILLILIVAFVGANAQKGAYIKFDNTTWDWGKIKEEDGKVKATFTFTNTGTDTLKIRRAVPSCSCTTTDWTKTPVAPGKTGNVLAYFDPYKHSGPFEKSVWVISNAKNDSVTLTIRANITPKPKTFTDSFPSRNGDLLFGKKAFYVMNMKNNEIKKDSMEVFNAWSKPMTIAFASLPAYITCKAVPTTVAPLKRGKIYISYDAAKKHDFGLITDYFAMMTNDSINPNKQMTFTGTIVEDFTKMTPTQKENAPKITFTNGTTLDFGTVTQGDIVKKTFTFKNGGKDTLFIRKAVPYKEDCKVMLTGNSAIEGGGTSGVEIDFDTKALNGDDLKRTILMTTNDPDKSFIILIIKGNVTAK